jgi:hypothetical protein
MQPIKLLIFVVQPIRDRYNFGGKNSRFSFNQSKTFFTSAVSFGRKQDVRSLGVANQITSFSSFNQSDKRCNFGGNFPAFC